MLCREVWNLSHGLQAQVPSGSLVSGRPHALVLLLCTCSPLFLFKVVQSTEGGLPWKCLPCGLTARIFHLSSWVGQSRLWMFWSSAGFGSCTTLWGSQRPLQPHGPRVSGARDPSRLGQGSRLRSLGQAWSAAPSPPVSLCSGPPSPAWLHPVTHVRFPRLLSAHSCFPCHSGFFTLAGNSIPAVLGGFSGRSKNLLVLLGVFASQDFLWF